MIAATAIAAGKAEEADAYSEHLIDQAAFVLQTQDIGVLMHVDVGVLREAARSGEEEAAVRRRLGEDTFDQFQAEWRGGADEFDQPLDRVGTQINIAVRWKQARQIDVIKPYR